MKYKVLPGNGNQQMEQTLKHPLLKNRLAQIQRIGEKNGTKRSVLTDERGVPLALVIDGANRHDSVLLGHLLECIMMKQTKKEEELEKSQEDDRKKPNLCLDAAFVGRESLVKKHGFIPHIRPRGEEKQLIEKDPTFKPRRWVVEATHSWFNRFRKLTPRYEKTDASYLALCMLAAALITLNKVMIIYG